MSTVAASLSRRVFAAAVLLVFAIAAMPAMAEPAAPLVSAQWLKEHQGDPAVVVLDIRSAIDGGGAEAYAQAHIPGAVHSDYDKAGWRVTRNGVPFMLPNKAGAREAHRRNRHRRGCPRRRRAGWRERDRLRLRRAGLLDAEDRRPSGGVDPRRRLRRLAGGGLSGRERQGRADAENLHGQARRARCSPKSKRSSATSNATLVDARPAELFSTARRRRRPPRPTATFPARSISTAPRSTIRRPTGCARRSKLAKIAASLPAGPVVAYCNTGHWAATDWFVLSAVLGRPDVRLYDGSMVEWTADPQSSGRELAHAASTISRRRSASARKAWPSEQKTSYEKIE